MKILFSLTQSIILEGEFSLFMIIGLSDIFIFSSFIFFNVFYSI